jgi:hypothetical protein
VRERIALSGFWFLLCAFCVLVLLTGCTRRPPTGPAAGSGPVVETPAALDRASLWRETDLRSCQVALHRVNTHWQRYAEQKPASLADGDRRFFVEHFGLSDQEWSEVESPVFTSIDAHHVEQCLLFRDAARALGVDGLAGRYRAAAAFAWTIRQVRRKDSAALAPPHFVLRRGWGNAMERALVFLCLLDQLGLEGCLVVSPGGKAGKQFWAAAALADGQLWLFEPRLGLPLPAPDGPGVATLAQVRSGSVVLDQLAVAPKRPYDVTAEQARQAELWLTASLPALAPRMRRLEKLLPAGEAAVLADDPAARLRRFQAVAGTVPVRFWDPAGDWNNPVRLLLRFLPVDEGGLDRAPPPEQRRTRFVRELFPEAGLPEAVRRLEGQPRVYLQLHFLRPFVDLSIEAGQPRDLMLRGRFDEAARKLVQRRDETRLLQERAQAVPDLAARVAQWTAEAQEAQRALSLAERRLQQEKSDDARIELDLAGKRMQAVLARSQAAVLLVHAAAAEPLAAEATYLLALCKHEQAERLQREHDRRGSARAAALLAASPPLPFPAGLPWPILADPAAAADTPWRSAADWWKTYLELYPDAGGVVAARFARSRALAALGHGLAAEAVLEPLTRAADPLDGIAARVRLRQLQRR